MAFTDPPAATDGHAWLHGTRVVVQLFGVPPGSTTPRAMGDGLMGDGLMGGNADEQAAEDWYDISAGGYLTTIIRGTPDGNLTGFTDQLQLSLYDDDGSLFDFTFPNRYDRGNVGTFIRVGLLTSDVTPVWQPMFLGRIELIEDVHDTPARNVTIYAAGVLTDLASDVDDLTTLQGDDAVDWIGDAATAVDLDSRWGTVSDLSGGRGSYGLDAATFTNSTARAIIDTACRSVVCYLDQDPANGNLRLRPWPLAYTAVGALDVADTADTTDLAVVTARYVSDTAQTLNVLHAYSAVDSARDGSAIDTESVNIMGRKSQAMGWPLSGHYLASGATLSTLLTDTLADTVNVASRPTEVTIETTTDPRWGDVVGAIDIGDSVNVTRVNVRPVPLTYRCVVVGLQHELTPLAHRCTLQLRTIEGTY